MILFLIGNISTGKTYFVKQVSSTFEEFRTFDDVTVKEMREHHNQVRTAVGAGQIVVIAFSAVELRLHLHLIKELATEWSTFYSVQILTPIPFDAPSV